MARGKNVEYVYKFKNGAGEERMIAANSIGDAYKIATGQQLSLKLATARELNEHILAGLKVERAQE